MATFTVTNVEERADGSNWSYAEVDIAIAGPQYDSSGHFNGGVAKAQTDVNGAVSFTNLIVGAVYTWTHPDKTQDTFQAGTAGTFALSTLVGPFVPTGAVGVTQAGLSAALAGYATTAQLGTMAPALANAHGVARYSITGNPADPDITLYAADGVTEL